MQKYFFLALLMLIFAISAESILHFTVFLIIYLMTKRLFFILFCLFCGSITLQSQSYDKLWKSVEDAIQKDHPQTALSALKSIEQKAMVEHKEGQLLASLLKQYRLQAEVSADSARALLLDIDRMAENKSDSTERAVWQATVGMMYLSENADTASVSRGKTLLLQSLVNREALGRVEAKEYLPLFVIGKDSRLYNNDLLSVIGKYVLENMHFSLRERCRVAARLIAYYRAKGNRPATLLATLDSLTLGNYPNRKTLVRLAEDYRDLGVNVETYILLTYAAIDADEDLGPAALDSIRLSYARKGLELYGKEKRAGELRNFIARTEQPRLNLIVDNNTIYPGKTVEAVLKGKNVSQVKLRFYRLNLRAADKRVINFERKNVKSMLKKPIQTLDYSFAPLPAYQSQSDTLAFKIDVPGVYCVELVADGKRMDEELLYVSRVFPLVQSSTDGKIRVRLLDAESGKLLKDGVVTEYEETRTELRQTKVYTPDETGEIVLSQTKRYDASKAYYASVGEDGYLPDFSVSFLRMDVNQEKKTEMHLNFFTDRAIYRPGQTVQYSGVAYTQQGDEVCVAKNYEVKIKLRDSNGQIVEETTLRTDEMGVLSGEYKLPEVCLPGYFRLVADRGLGSLSFKVEEYKRPTFTVEIDEISTAYQLGDTVRLCGTVKTYTGLPLAGCRVKFNVERSVFYRVVPDDEFKAQLGETVTDSLGRFSFPVILSCVAEGETKMAFSRINYSVSIDATAETGETASITHLIPVTNRAVWLSANWPASFCKEALERVTVVKTGASGKQMEGKIDYTLYNGDKNIVKRGHIQSGQTFVPTMLEDLNTGRYEIAFVSENTDTLRQAFLFFSEFDTKPVGEEVLWQYVRQSEKRDSALVVIGSPCKDVTLFYNLFTADRRLENRVVTFSDSLLRFPLAYRPEMGEGARASFAFVKEGKVYVVKTSVVKPKPDKRLVLNWSSFRSRLVPGQEETWQLRISRPDGTPVEASLMARLYDASLDAFAQHDWRFDYHFSRNIGYIGYDSPRTSPLWFSAYFPIKTEKTSSLSFTQWNEMLSQVYGKPGMSYVLSAPTSAKGAFYKTTSRNLGTVRMQHAEEGTIEERVASADGALPDVTPRSNFAETAFFHPALRTDAEGRVTLSFTLPESLTAWNFTALAHSRAMDYGRLDTTVVARKEFMVQAAMPRFVRQGDRVVVPVSLRNISDKRVEGTLKFVLIDPETDKVMKSVSKKFALSVNGSEIQSLEFVADYNIPVLVFRATASAGNFSDGEEHYLLILADRVSVSRSVPFSIEEAGTLDLRLDTLWTDENLAADRRLTVEISSNPVWYALAALPSLSTKSSESAVGWALRYYATVLAGRIATLNPDIATLLKDGETGGWANVLQRNPELKQTLLAETPWVAEAQTEAERIMALRRLLDKQAVAANKYSALDHLKELQQADGSWSWYRGMSGNAYITSEVALLLSRLQALCGDEDADNYLSRAMDYLSGKIAEDVKEMKKHREESGIGETHVRWLYIRALQDLKPDATAKYLMDRAVKASRNFTMYGKALLAVVLEKAGRSDEAADVLKSLKEYTVYSPTMGRYFDTDKAVSSWSSYRIPTQTAVIEALLCAPTVANVEAANEMRLWLMQAKRTQMWETGRATADAVYALLQPVSGDNPVMSLKSSDTPLLYTLKRGNKVLAVNASSEAQGKESAGYYCRTYTNEKVLSATSMTVRKQDKGLSWGSVVAHYTLPTAAVKQTGSGLHLTRRFEIKEGNVWRLLEEEANIKAGDVLRQIFTIKADRDYDFVVLKSARAANLAPRRPLSGYTWNDGLGAYRAVRDASTDFFIEKLPKGTYTLTEEYVCDRSGRYRCGTSTLSSVYAPEFSAQTPGFVIDGK